MEHATSRPEPSHPASIKPEITLYKLFRVEIDPQETLHPCYADCEECGANMFTELLLVNQRTGLIIEYVQAESKLEALTNLLEKHELFKVRITC